MFIIWGTKHVAREVKGGIVVKKRCPKCDEFRLLYEFQNYQYFTIFFIPVLPLGKSGSSFLRCIVCNTDYFLSPNDIDFNDKSRQLEFDDRITVSCPSCGVKLKVKPFDQEEVKIRCKGCNHIFLIKKNYRSY